MNTQDYNKWLQDPAVLKVDDHSSIELIDEANRILVLIFWSHRGAFPNKIGSPDESDRFIINVYSGNQFHSILEEIRRRAEHIERYKYLMVNTHEPDYACLFSLELDKAKGEFRLSLINAPEMGANLMTKKERTSIIINF